MDTFTLLVAAAVNVFLLILLLIAAKLLKRHADKVRGNERDWCTLLEFLYVYKSILKKGIYEGNGRSYLKVLNQGGMRNLR